MLPSSNCFGLRYFVYNYRAALKFPISSIKLQNPKCRQLQQLQNITTGVPNLNKNILDDWKTVYRFNHIVAAKVVQRLKIYQTGFTCFVLLPWSLVGSYLDYSSAYVAYFCLGTSVLACTMLAVIGTMSSRFIGFLYVNKEDPTKLRVARLSFFGSRTDKVVPSSIFVPLQDTSEKVEDAYVVLETVGDVNGVTKYPLLRDLFPMFLEDKYYLSIRYGTIYDLEAFTSIFGDIPSIRKKITKQ